MLVYNVALLVCIVYMYIFMDLNWWFDCVFVFLTQTEKSRIQRLSPMPSEDIYSTKGTHRFAEKVSQPLLLHLLS